MSGTLRVLKSLRGRRVLFPLVMVLLFVLTTGCNKGTTTGSSTQVQGKGNNPEANGRLDQPPIPVAVAAAMRGPIATYFHATATLEANKQAQVLARVGGLVDALLCEEGDEVQAGQVLLKIQNREYLLKLQQAQAQTANLKAKFERLQAMLEQQMVTQEEFEAARSDLASAQAEEGLADMNLSYTSVKAPFAGRITQRLVDVGQNLAVGTPLVVLADFHPLLAKVHVPSREFHKLQRDQEVALTLDSNNTVIKGRIKLISPVIDPASGTIKLTIEVPEYPAGTRPGDFAEVRIVTELRPQALLVPRAAVLTDQGETVVYLVTDPPGKDGSDQVAQVAERRVVEVGFTDDDHAEILAGLQPGENVVVRGQRSLKHGSPVKVLDDKPVAAES